MKVFRQFDYFRKSTSPEAIKPTFLGGLISLFCVSMITILVYNELIMLNTPEITKNTTVSTDPDKRPHILVNMDFVFPNTPCYLLDLDMKTSVNTMDSAEMTRALAWSHVDANGKVVETSANSDVIFPAINLDDAANTPQKIKKWFDSNQTCQVTGSLDVTKVNG